MNKILIGVLVIVLLVILYEVYVSSSGASALTTPTTGSTTTPTTSAVAFGCQAAQPGITNNYGILGRDSTGTVQCLTSDGTNCHWYPTLSGCQTALAGMGSPPAGTPLVCGSTAMTNAWGAVSPTANTWCLSRTDF